MEQWRKAVRFGGKRGWASRRHSLAGMQFVTFVCVFCWQSMDSEVHKIEPSPTVIPNTTSTTTTTAATSAATTTTTTTTTTAGDTTTRMRTDSTSSRPTTLSTGLTVGPDTASTGSSCIIVIAIVITNRVCIAPLSLDFGCAIASRTRFTQIMNSSVSDTNRLITENSQTLYKGLKQRLRYLLTSVNGCDDILYKTACVKISRDLSVELRGC